MFIKILCFLVFTILTIPAIAYASNTAALFVFDGSGSMLEEIQGKAKIDLAKDAMRDLLKDFPTGTDLGLVAYGHREKDGCDDIEMLAPVGSGKETVIEAITSIIPKGNTPLAEAIRFAAEQLKGRDAPASIIVISDGKETCNGDPCEVAKVIKASSVDIRIHVIGFDVNADEAKQLQCIAKNGGGKYFSAGNAAELAKSFAAVKQEVVEKKPVPKVIFRDDFDEDFLSEDWDVQNPDAGAMLLDEGQLMLMAKEASLGKGNVPNFIVLNKEITPTHYTVSVKLHSDFSQEKYGLGSQYAGLLLYADPKNFLELWVQNDGDEVLGKSQNIFAVNTINAYFQKISEGEASKYPAAVTINWQNEYKKTTTMPFDAWLRIEKNKYKFTAYASRDGEKWQVVGTIPFLGKKLKPALFTDRSKNVSDTLVGFDWFEVSELVKE